jgi:mono/diheme cytochrome c family protein
LCLAGCGSTEEKNKNASAENLIKDVHDTEVKLPDATGAELFTPGAEAFKANCITCHSLRYIQMQPDFPEKTWQKIVDKMVNSFGASIPDSTSKAIVRYLMAIKGQKEIKN